MSRRLPSTLSSWRALGTRIGRLPPSLRVLSIDVFDTLVFRRVDPDLIQLGTSRELVRRLGALGVAVVRDPLAARREAEFTVARSKAERGLELEAPLAETVREWIPLLAGCAPAYLDELADRIVAFEIASEARAAVPNEALRCWLEARRADGLRLVFCSDTHLGVNGLRKVLAVAGLGSLFAAGYASCDAGVSKGTGRLFASVLSAERVEPHELLHIGDSPLYDGAGARAAGCRALVVADRATSAWRARSRFDAERLGVDSGWAGIVAAAAAERGARHATPEERFGHQVLGPIVAAFAHRAAEICRERGVRRIFFLAREGFSLKAAHEEIAATVWPDGNAPPTSYLSISRVVALRAAADGLGPEELEAAEANHARPTLRRLLAPLGVPKAEMLRTAQAGALGIDESLAPGSWRRPPLAQLLADPELAARVRACASRERRLLHEILRAEGYFAGGTVALVDVGWGGLMQRSLERAFGHEEGAPQLLGLYAGLDHFSAGRAGARSERIGVLADAEAAPTDWHGAALLAYAPLFEALLRAPHGTVLRYEADEDGRAYPVLRADADPARAAELRDEPLLALFQSGIRRYGESYAGSARMLGFAAADALPYALACCDRLLRYPELAEARWLASLTSVCDLGLAEVTPLGRLGRADARHERAFAIPARISGALWPHGAAARLLGRILRHAILPRIEDQLAPLAASTPLAVAAAPLPASSEPTRPRPGEAAPPCDAPGSAIETAARARSAKLIAEARAVRPDAPVIARHETIAPAALVAGAFHRRLLASRRSRRGLPPLAGGAVAARLLVRRTWSGSRAAWHHTTRSSFENGCRFWSESRRRNHSSETFQRERQSGLKCASKRNAWPDPTLSSDQVETTTPSGSCCSTQSQVARSDSSLQPGPPTMT